MASCSEQYTRQELIAVLQDLKQKLGRMPTKKDIPERIRPLYRKEFGKWCYALEAAGVKIPSAVTLARRARHKSRWKKKHRDMSHVRSEKQIEKKGQVIKDSNQQC